MGDETQNPPRRIGTVRLLGAREGEQWIHNTETYSDIATRNEEIEKRAQRQYEADMQRAKTAKAHYDDPDVIAAKLDYMEKDPAQFSKIAGAFVRTDGEYDPFAMKIGRDRAEAAASEQYKKSMKQVQPIIPELEAAASSKAWEIARYATVAHARRTDITTESVFKPDGTVQIPEGVSAEMHVIKTGSTYAVVITPPEKEMPKLRDSNKTAEFFPVIMEGISEHEYNTMVKVNVPDSSKLLVVNDGGWNKNINVKIAGNIENVQVKRIDAIVKDDDKLYAMSGQPKPLPKPVKVASVSPEQRERYDGQREVRQNPFGGAKHESDRPANSIRYSTGNYGTNNPFGGAKHESNRPANNIHYRTGSYRTNNSFGGAKHESDRPRQPVVIRRASAEGHTPESNVTLLASDYRKQHPDTHGITHSPEDRKYLASSVRVEVQADLPNLGGGNGGPDRTA